MNKNINIVRAGLVLFALMLALSVIGSAQFPAQSYGNLQITRATYGNGERVRDVTALLNSQIRNGRLMMEVNNRTLGGDPAEGRPKTLTVWYVHFGRSLQASVPERSMLNLGGPAMGLRIIRAEYGSEHRLMDVTSRLNSQVRGDRLSLQINNDTMGGDPAEDRRKELIVWYSFNGRTARAMVNEKDVLEIPGTQGYSEGDLHILRAQYGADYRYHDVTALLNSRVQNDSLNLQINNDTMGGDPADDKRKTLVVSYLYQGETNTVRVNEKEYLTLPGTMANPWANDSANLEILRATWGTAGGSADVTAVVASRLQGGHLEMPVTRETMGIDPAPEQVKLLKVIYLWQGLRYETNVPEKGTLILP